MEEFSSMHPSGIPTPEQQEELLAKIKAKPGCEGFKLQKLSACHQRQRRLTDPTVLSENSIDKLRILRRENPSPSVQLIHTWAELLKEQPDEVAKWVRDQHDHESDEQTPIPHHLPTPTSTSPEPFEGQASFEPQCSLSPAGVPDQLFSKPSWKLLSTTELIEAIAVAASQPIQTTRIPSNCEEFDEMFNEYLPKMERIVHQNSQFISKAPCHSDDF